MAETSRALHAGLISVSFRTKIIAPAIVLLAILSIALLVTYRAQREVYEELTATMDYHIPLDTLVTDIQTKAGEYELSLYRMLSRPPERAAMEALARSANELMVAIKADLDRMEKLLTAGIVDPRNDDNDRVIMSRIQGMLVIMRRQLAPIEEMGRGVLEAHGRGDMAAATLMLTGFEGRTALLDPDLLRLRSEIQRLSLASTTEAAALEEYTHRFSLITLLIASVLGLSLAFLSASRLVVGLRRLVEGAQAVERGTLSEALPVTSRDEVGQLTTAFNHMVSELRTKETMRKTFGSFVDPRIVSRLMAATGDGAEIAERRVATVFFSDIAGFSGISEQLTASVIANLLNRWFTLCTEAIRAHNGVVDKYIGDSVMAFWAAPFSPGDDHAADACLAALAQQQAADVLRVELPQLLGLRRNVPELEFRMGIATGEVVVGSIGAPTARSFTVIGDVANLASRLEGINKAYGTRIIVGEDTFRLAQSAVVAREIDLITVAGKTEPVRIYELLGRVESLSAEQESARRRFAEGLAAYRSGDWALAEAAFGDVDGKRQGGDAPSRLFIERIGALRSNPPPPDWNGVWRFTKK